MIITNSIHEPKNSFLCSVFESRFDNLLALIWVLLYLKFHCNDHLVIRDVNLHLLGQILAKIALFGGPKMRNFPLRDRDAEQSSPRRHFMDRDGEHTLPRLDYHNFF